MTWSISVSGTKAKTATELRALTFEHTNGDVERAEAEALRDACVKIADNTSTTHVGISASGSNTSASVSISKWTE